MKSPYFLAMSFAITSGASDSTMHFSHGHGLCILGFEFMGQSFVLVGGLMNHRGMAEP
jgi:hypothetical protein